MNSKKAQISLFLIIGVVLFLLVALLLFATGGGEDPTEDLVELPFERAAISNFMTNCLKDTAEEAIKIVGKQGGYLEPSSYVSSDTYNIAYLYDKGTPRVPGKADVARDISKYVDRNMVSCLNNFKSFERLGWKVTYEQPETRAQLNERDVTVTQQFLVSIEKDNVISFQEFTYTVPVRLSYMIDITNEIVNFHKIEPEWTDLTELSKHDVDITIFPYEQKLMYSIKDPQSTMKSQAYMFNFALDFN